MKDFLVRGTLEEIDPDVHEIIRLESERQFRKIILIPSESTAPYAVREAMGSVFQNLYAEGYPDEETRWMKEDEILDYTMRLGNFRRYSDPRYYKGVEYADIIESLARRRAAEVFATPIVSADQLYANVQALSGAPANNAVYNALINPGDTILGMNLLHGGHLSHGSSVNRSGKLYKAVHYSVDPETEQINYDAVMKIAVEQKPKVIIAGYSSYPWVPDWKKFREIADATGAFLLADVSHIAGLIAAGVIPSPVGHAHIITFTTHKTLDGPRGAVIMTTDSKLSSKIDRAVFPGEQGGPHVHIFAALAVMFKLATTDHFKELQHQTVKNSVALTNRLIERGLRIPFKGTNTHLGNLDCKSVVGKDGTPLSGDMAARVLDIAGLVMNRNTIPGDKTALKASGIRFGTPWITQRGLKEDGMIQIADIMADVLLATHPYLQKKTIRAKIDFEVLEDAKIRARTIAESAGFDGEVTLHGYPHFYYLDDKPMSKSGWAAFDLKGKNIRQFVNYAFSNDSEHLQPGQSQKTRLHTPKDTIECVITCVEPDWFKVNVPNSNTTLAATWLRELSDGYIQFDADIERKLPGPMAIPETTAQPFNIIDGEFESGDKPYYIGMGSTPKTALPVFHWEEAATENLRRTPLYEVHKKLGAKLVPFAGWEMPVWYSSVIEEHHATRQAAGLFDVAHMGVFQTEGPDAATFLDSVCSNDIGALLVGESCYTHFLDPEANVIDDLLVYRRNPTQYLVVVNASNDDKDWAWLNAVHDGKALVDTKRPWAKAFGRNVILRNLRDPKEGDDMRVDIALQGRKSRDILLALGCDAGARRRIMALKRTNVCEAVVGGIDLVVSRTGYTGENMAFELFVHPNKAVDLWEALMKAGEPLGLKPCGLGARDSLRTEFGLPLYGHEMSGLLNLGVAEAGFSAYVKTYKPWFIGRDAYLERESTRKGEVVRFKFTEKGVRMAHLGDPVIEGKGRVIGKVSSCAIDIEGYLTGQAFIETKYTEIGSPIYIYQSAPTNADKAPADLIIGERVKFPTPATIIERFAKLI